MKPAASQTAAAYSVLRLISVVIPSDRPYNRACRQGVNKGAAAVPHMRNILCF